MGQPFGGIYAKSEQAGGIVPADDIGVFAPVFTFQGYRRTGEEGLAATVPWLIAAYAASWILVQSLSPSGLRLDAYEMLAMGHEWQLAYWKHPALPPWIAEAVFQLSGRSVFAVAVLPVACVCAGLWVVWKLCQPIFGNAGAALATALSLGSWYLMAPVEQFNHNIAQLPFWALTVFAYRRAIRAPSYAAWLSFAAVALLLLETKYTGVLLLATLAAHALWFGEGRRVLREPQALAGMLLFAALASLQTVYVLRNVPTAFTYALDRPPYGSFLDHLLGPFAILGAQLLFHSAVVLLLVAVHPFGARQRMRATVIGLPKISAFDRSLLISATAGPLALGLLFYAFSPVWGRSEAFGSIFMLVGPSVLACYGRVLYVARPRFSVGLLMLALFGPPAGSATEVVLQPTVHHRVQTEQIPYAAAADVLAQDWQRRTGRPLTIIAGSADVAGGFAAFMDPRPSVLLDGMPARSPWITKERLAADGALLVWRIKSAGDMRPPRQLIAPLAGFVIEPFPPVVVHTAWDRYAPPPRFGLAIVRAR